eukprot:Rmarinus@m.5435
MAAGEPGPAIMDGKYVKTNVQNHSLDTKAEVDLYRADVSDDDEVTDDGDTETVAPPLQTSGEPLDVSDPKYKSISAREVLHMDDWALRFPALQDCAGAALTAREHYLSLSEEDKNKLRRERANDLRLWRFHRNRERHQKARAENIMSALEKKEKLSHVAKERRAKEAAERMKGYEEKRKLREERIKEIAKEKEVKKEKLLARLSDKRKRMDQRDAIVRAQMKGKIQSSVDYTPSSRSVQHVKRDAPLIPGPGAYDVSVRWGSGPKIGIERRKDPLWAAQQRALFGPGPGEYDPRPVGENKAAKTIGEKNITLMDHVKKQATQTPSPHDYVPSMPIKRKSKLGANGAKWGTSYPKSDLDWKVYFASQLPGPGDYEVREAVPLQGGRFGNAEPKSEFDWIMYHSRQLPGPTEYTPAPVHRTKSFTISATSSKSDVEWMMYHARSQPGASEYFPTPTFREELATQRDAKAIAQFAADELNNNTSLSPSGDNSSPRRPRRVTEIPLPPEMTKNFGSPKGVRPAGSLPNFKLQPFPSPRGHPGASSHPDENSSPTPLKLNDDNDEAPRSTSFSLQSRSVRGQALHGSNVSPGRASTSDSSPERSGSKVGEATTKRKPKYRSPYRSIVGVTDVKHTKETTDADDAVRSAQAIDYARHGIDMAESHSPHPPESHTSSQSPPKHTCDETCTSACPHNARMQWRSRKRSSYFVKQSPRLQGKSAMKVAGAGVEDAQLRGWYPTIPGKKRSGRQRSGGHEDGSVQADPGHMQQGQCASPGVQGEGMGVMNENVAAAYDD